MSSPTYRLQSWLIDEYQWSRLALPCAVILLASLPLFRTASNQPLILVFSLLPIYMIHQYEEHAHGKFVPFFNATVGRGAEVLSPRSAFWINILTVWLLFLVTDYLAKYWVLGIAFIPIFITLFNGLTHVISSIVAKRYTPGLGTSVVLFFPWGGFLFVYVAGKVDHVLAFTLVGIVGGIAAHAVIVVFALRRRSALSVATRSRVGAPS